MECFELKSNQIKRLIIYVLYGAFLGAVIGVISWLFLVIVDQSIHFLWHTAPEALNIESGIFVIMVCTIGGVFVGICQKKFGKYPREMVEVINEYKTEKRIDYSNMHKGVISGTIALLFGASLGPEATLVGIIGGLCTWTSDNLWVERKKRPPLSEKGIRAKTKYYVYSPLRALFVPNKKEKNIKIEIPKSVRYSVYVITAVVGYWVFSNLFDMAHLDPFIIEFGAATVNKTEWIALIPLIIVGILLGNLYNVIGRTIKFSTKFLNKYKVLKAVIGGLVLGIFGILLPMVLFSGEHELHELIEGWELMPAYMLLIIGLSKMFLTQFCLKTGWRGGQIYPLIFSGACIGYMLSSYFSIDPITSVALVVTGMCCSIIKKRYIMAIVLCLFFPYKLWLFIVLAAAIAGVPDKFNTKYLQYRQQKIA